MFFNGKVFDILTKLQQILKHWVILCYLASFLSLDYYFTGSVNESIFVNYVKLNILT